MLLVLQLQFTRVMGPAGAGGMGQYPTDSTSLVLPLIYDTTSNVTQLAEKRDSGPASAITTASMLLKRFLDCTGSMHTECSLYPAVRELLGNLILPSEPPQVG